ncbi:Cyclin-dependent kinase inhibitor 4 [Sesamum alatum]|uniref:Cyclin-dependent kinase inhibitor n=1 Tax=Sesamum alatum TaxID=300844 RepID=A0AAE1XXM8_9LAMI|nr:Cyclin-dependent kinase inhibitor 4 [Sesamum alatum]
MGKYMRKARARGAAVAVAVALMEISHSSLGVRTRSKTLALQRLQASSPSKSDSCCLQLRSRRLVRPLHQQNCGKARQKCGCVGKDNPEVRGDEEFPATGSIEAEDLGIIEANFGENCLDCGARERSIRESTPCSLIGGNGTISTPGSTTKQACSDAASQRARSLLINVPTASELEAFFAHEEQSQQHVFIEKYNFDMVNDLPLPGHYEWVRVRP